jgi:hypothetical protein
VIFTGLVLPKKAKFILVNGKKEANLYRLTLELLIQHNAKSGIRPRGGKCYRYRYRKLTT